MTPKQYGRQVRMPGTMFGTKFVRHKAPPPRPTAALISHAMLKALLDVPRGPSGPAGPSGYNHDDAVALEAAWLDLKDAILTPRSRRVIRDEYGQIIGLTDG